MAVLGKLPHLRTLRLLEYSYRGTKMVCSSNERVRRVADKKRRNATSRSLSLDYVKNLRIFSEGL
ncbi:hypothetical protein QQP08_005068, partial [Theobroma cacao]